MEEGPFWERIWGFEMGKWCCVERVLGGVMREEGLEGMLVRGFGFGFGEVLSLIHI